MKRVLLGLIRFYQRFISPGTSETVPVLADMLAVRARGDREIRRIKGRVAGF